MDEQETVEAIAALVGIALFFSLATIGTIITSTDADSFLYIEFNPEEDFFILICLIFINMVFLFYFFAQSSKFRKSKNLNYRIGELLYISDKMKVYSIFYVPVEAFLTYYFIKYNPSSITLSLLIILLIGILLILMFFYNSFRIKRDLQEEIAEK